FLRRGCLLFDPKRTWRSSLSNRGCAVARCAAPSGEIPAQDRDTNQLTTLGESASSILQVHPGVDGHGPARILTNDKSPHHTPHRGCSCPAYSDARHRYRSDILRHQPADELRNLQI